MNLKVLVPVANGTEDVESSTIIDLLRRAGINVIVAGTDSPVKFARGMNIIPDLLLSELNHNEKFDAIILPGGMPGVTNLSNDKDLKIILDNHIKNKKITGAICAAPLILKEHKYINSNAVLTSFPTMESEFSEYNYSHDKVVVYNNIITSKGLGTAIDFSLKLIEMLIDKDTAKKISDEIVYTN